MPAPPDRSFHALAGANLAAQSAEQISLAALPLVAVLALGAGTAEIGWLNMAQTLPFLLLALPLGLWADRHPRRPLMAAGEAWRAAALAGLAWLTLQGTASLPWLALLGFLGATGTVAFNVAAPALVPALVAADRLSWANGRLELARSLAFAAGPALGGALVGQVGAGPAFGLALGLSLLAVALLATLHEPPRPAPPRRQAWAELREGAALVWQHPLLRPVLLTAVAWNLAWFVMQSAYVPHAVRHLGLGAQGVGLTLATYGAGMVAGALAAPRILAALPFGRVVVLGPVVSVLAMACLVASLAWPHAAWAALAMALFGAGPILWTISSVTLRQTVTPPALLGRVSAMFLTVNAGARPVGAALGAGVGLAVQAWPQAPLSPEAACLWLALAGFVLQAGLIWRSAVAGLAELPASAAP